MATAPELEFMFNPENIAIVGVSDEPIGMASFFDQLF